MYKTLFFIVTAIIFGDINAAGVDPEVTLSTGKVQGYTKQSPGGRVYYAFEGIPYARPPVGKHRFEEPKPMKPWFGVWQAKTLSTCLQYYHYTEPGQDYVRGDEDCLHVNVYTPDLKPTGTLKDVIVYIHGGAFMFNSGGTYGEKYLVDKNIVYVSLNYRLGPLGFLSTESRYLPGNMGIKDQKLALRWIKENIRNFGGNPDSITLTGMSAGGVSVHVHTLSSNPNVQLFNRAIAQSGSALNPWALMEKAREKTVKLSELLGCPAYDTKEMIKCLKYRPGRQIVAAVKHFQPWLYNPFSPFSLVIDKWSDEPVLPEHPYQLLKTKQVQNIPIIFSNVQAEGLYPGAEFAFEEKLAEIDDRFEYLVPFILDYNNTVAPKDISSVTQKIREFYFKDHKVNMASYKQLIQMLTDRIFLVDNERAARLHAAANSEETYFYYYSYQSANSKQNQRTKSKISYGTSHGDDTIMVLSTDIDITSTESDKAMSQLLQGMWTSFAHSSTPKVGDFTWETLSQDTQEPFKYLHIKSPSDVIMESVEYIGNRINFWDTLPINENQNIKVVRDEL